MIDRPGRKALFTGPVAPATAGHEQGPVVLPEAIESALHAGLEGDAAARINLAGIPEAFRPLAVSINALLDKKEEEKQAIRHRLDEARALLKESDKIIEQNPMPILIVDPQFKILTANIAYAEMSGIPQSQMTGRSLRDFKIVSQQGSGLRQVLQEKRQAHGEVVVELPSGVHTLEQYGLPLLDEKGAIESILIVYNDVTRQREEEEEIRIQMENIAELQRQSDTLIQKNPMPILVVDAGMKILTANEAYLRLTGIDRARIATMTLRDFKVLAQNGDGVRKVLAEKVEVYGEVTVEFPAGTYILEQYGIPLTNERGELTGILIVYNDVTEKRKEADEIRRMQQRIDTMIRQNPLAIATLRPDKSRIDINDEYARMWRGTREETLAKKLYDYDITILNGDHFYATNRRHGQMARRREEVPHPERHPDPGRKGRYRDGLLCLERLDRSAEAEGGGREDRAPGRRDDQVKPACDRDPPRRQEPDRHQRRVREDVAGNPRGDPRKETLRLRHHHPQRRPLLRWSNGPTV